MNEITKPAPAGETTELATIQTPASSLLNFIASALENPQVDVTKLQALLDMQRQVVADEAKARFNQAFLRIQGKLPRVKKSGVLQYPVDKNKPDGPKRHIANFATYEDIDEAIRPLLDEEGFSLSYTTAQRSGDGGGLIVTANLRHSAGHSEQTSIPVPLDTSGGKNSIQGYGSALKYGRRYTMTAILNIVTEGEDDDGVRAGMQFITADQVEQVRALLCETGTDEAKFLQFFGVAHIASIEAAQYTPAINMLNAKRAKAQHR